MKSCFKAFSIHTSFKQQLSKWMHMKKFKSAHNKEMKITIYLYILRHTAYVKPLDLSGKEN